MRLRRSRTVGREQLLPAARRIAGKQIEECDVDVAYVAGLALTFGRQKADGTSQSRADDVADGFLKGLMLGLEVRR